MELAGDSAIDGGGVIKATIRTEKKGKRKNAKARSGGTSKNGNKI